MPEARKYIIGVDGGGTKTKVVLSNTQGRIIKKITVGPAHIRNIGLEKTVIRIVQAVEKLLKRKNHPKVIATSIALTCLEEEYKGYEKRIKKMISKFKGRNSLGRVFVISDQLEALWSVTEKQQGVVLIAGTGSVVHGWNNRQEVKIGGWGFLDDEGSSFWVGRRTFEAILKDVDGRGKKTLMTSLFFEKKRNLQQKEKFIRAIYENNFVRNVSLMSKITARAAQKGDEIAQNILKEGAKEIFSGASIVITKLRFKREFPVILVGSMFKSDIYLEIIKNNIYRNFPEAKVVFVKEPVKGAINFALKKI